MDSIICPVTGKEIGEGEGNAAQDSRGNVWIVHKDAGDRVHTDGGIKPTVNGVPPFMGPDA